MTAHVHKEHEGEALVDAAQRVLTGAGEQWTDLRAEVFEHLAHSEAPASAYDIADAMSARRGRRVAANSVYRILDLFVRRNLVNRIETANAYVVNSHPGCRHDCIFLICESCGRASHIDDDRLTASLRERAASEGFGEVSTVVELRGTCPDCTA